jgi:hypothetical protein
VNHPELRTIYPPVAQGAFALAHGISPFSLGALRAVFALFDALVLALLVVALKSLGLSPLWSVLYWWNPLVLKEVFNSSHMDVLVLPFLLGAVIMATRHRYLLSTLLLAGAVGTKVWPVILLPVLLRPLWKKPKALVPALILFGGVCVVLFVPVVTGGLDSNSGFTAYGKKWEMNDALFMLVLWGAKLFSAEHGALLARIAASLLLAGWILKVSIPEPSGGPDLWNRCTAVTAALFILSPTQFPWYFLWVLPFIVIRPRFSLFLLTALLPLYYLRFHLKVRSAVSWFDYGIVWIEYVPVWIILAWEGWRERTGSVPSSGRGETTPATEAC